jgi:hypothetical protein
MPMQILHIPIQDEEILAIEDFKKYIKETTGKTIDSTDAVRLIVRYVSQDFKSQKSLF